MKFTLIMCTIGRTEEPKRLLDSLALQTHRDFKLIIVDQNTDGRLDQLVAEFSATLSITHLNSSPGLSKARNVGLKYASEGIVAFPDDDCWYPANLLEQVSHFFSTHKDYDAISINRAASETAPRHKAREVTLSKYNVWGKVPSICLFLRYQTIIDTGEFDEALGVGSGTPWGAGEDSDYVLSSLTRGHKWGKKPAMVVFHPDTTTGRTDKEIARVRNYARGLGRVLRKHKIPFFLVLGSFSLTLFRLVKMLAMMDSKGFRWYKQELLGKLEGFSSL